MVVGTVLLVVLTAAYLALRAAIRGEGAPTEVPARAAARARAGAPFDLLGLEDALRKSLEAPARSDVHAAVDFFAVLGAARDALEAGRHAELAEHLSTALADVDGLVAWVARLADSDAEPEVEEAEYDVLQFGLRLLLGIKTGLEREGQRAAAAEFGPALDALLTGILVRLGELPREVALEILRDLERVDVLDVGSLDLLVRWLVPLGYCEPLARLVARLALREDPPRMELLMDLVHHGDPALQLLVAQLLADQQGPLGLELAWDLVRTLPSDSALLREVDRLICRKAEPSQAFDHLLQQASERGEDDLMMAAMELGERDLGPLPFECYGEELDPGNRWLLVFAGRKDAEFLEYVVETDTEAWIRGTALVQLASKRPDERTAASLVADLEALTRGSWPDAFGPSLTRTLHSQSVLHATGNLVKSAPPSVRAGPSYQRLRTYITQLAERPDLDEASKEIARSVLLSFGP